MEYPRTPFSALCYFLLYINDLPLGTNIDYKLLLYTDDTSVLISGPDFREVQSISLNALDSINK
jgi:hypothetical protein